ncbi:MAG TPA: PKD domain-containing protein, partial [Thermoplasmatales archaeon]|nr:PKD domain-containing protein [Thermoplasmatales archaeon]
MSSKKQKIMGLIIVLMMMLPATGTLASLGSSSGMKVTLSASKTNVYVYEKIVFTAKIEKNGGSVTSLASHQYKYYYRFDFGDRRYVTGYTDDDEIKVTHSYSYSGTYNAKVYVKDQQTGEEEETWLSSAITVQGGNKAPVAKIKTSSNTAKTGENIRFDGSSSYDPDGYIKTYIWSFGDGRMGNGKIVTHSYNSPGRYTIKLTVTDNKGKKDTETKTITVNNQPTPSEFTVSLSASKTTVDIGEKIVFTAKIQNNNGGVTTLASHQYKYYYRFDFGDNKNIAGYTDDDEIKVTHSYSNGGTYHAKVYVKDQQTGKYKETWLSSSITVQGGNKAPVARIKLSSPTAKVGENIRFDGSQSYDPDGYIKTFIWVFGDGKKSNGRIVNHAYSTPGKYYVKLTVVDNKGGRDTETKTLVINGDEPIPASFSVSLSASKTVADVNEKIVFTAKIENDNGGVTTLASHQYKYYYRFDFGDNKHVVGYVDDAGVVKVSHVYSISGKYNAKVTVTERATGSSKNDVVAVNVKGNG